MYRPDARITVHKPAGQGRGTYLLLRPSRSSQQLLVTAAEYSRGVKGSSDLCHTIEAGVQRAQAANEEDFKPRSEFDLRDLRDLANR